MNTNEWIKYGKTTKGQQRWRNKITKQLKTDDLLMQPKEVKYLAIKMHLCGLSFNKCSEIVGVSPATVYNWFIKFGELIKNTEGLNVDIDEMWHYCLKKNKKSGSL
jgi:transposase-like protein